MLAQRVDRGEPEPTCLKKVHDPEWAGPGSKLTCGKGLGQTPHLLGLLSGVNSIPECF